MSDRLWLDQFDEEVILAAQDAAAAVLAQHGVMLQTFALALDFMSADGERGWIAGGPEEQLHAHTLSLFEHGAAYHAEIRRLGFHEMLRRAEDGE